MNSRRRNPKNSFAPNRSGLVAVTEIVVVVSILAGLFLLGTQMFSSIAEEAASSRNLTRSTSPRGVYRISLNQVGDRIWIYRPRDQITQLDVVTREVHDSIAVAGAELSAVAHSADGMTTVMSGIDGSMYLWRAGEGITHERRIVIRDAATDAAVSEDGRIAVCATPSGVVAGWVRDETSVREIQFELPKCDSNIVKIGLNRSGRQLIVSRSDGLISFYNAATGLIDGQPLDVGAECTVFALSQDERSMAVASVAGFARIYDLVAGTIVAEFEMKKSAHSDRPTAIALSPDGKWLVAASNTMKGIYLANTTTGEPFGRIAGHDGIVRCLQFSPDSSRFYSGSYDGTVRVWSPISRLQTGSLE